jgi:hypothetical protein
LNGNYDVYIYDRVQRSFELVSPNTSGLSGGNGNSWGNAVSGDGRFVCFLSDATDLVPGDTNGFRDVFVRDRQLQTTTRDNVDGRGRQANDDAYDAFMSSNGRFVAFGTSASVLGAVGGEVFVRDRLSARTTKLTEFAEAPYPLAVDDKGGVLLGAADLAPLVPNDTNGFVDLYRVSPETHWKSVGVAPFVESAPVKATAMTQALGASHVYSVSFATTDGTSYLSAWIRRASTGTDEAVFGTYDFGTDTFAEFAGAFDSVKSKRIGAISISQDGRSAVLDTKDGPRLLLSSATATKFGDPVTIGGVGTGEIRPTVSLYGSNQLRLTYQRTGGWEGSTYVCHLNGDGTTSQHRLVPVNFGHRVIEGRGAVSVDPSGTGLHRCGLLTLGLSRRSGVFLAWRPSLGGYDSSFLLTSGIDLPNGTQLSGCGYRGGRLYVGSNTGVLYRLDATLGFAVSAQPDQGQYRLDFRLLAPPTARPGVVMFGISEAIVPLALPSPWRGLLGIDPNSALFLRSSLSTGGWSLYRLRTPYRANVRRTGQSVRIDYAGVPLTFSNTWQARL